MRDFAPPATRDARSPPVRVAPPQHQAEVRADTAARAFGVDLPAGDHQSLPSPQMATAAAKAVSAGGRMLAASERAYFGPVLGPRLDHVLLHTDARAAMAAQAIGARAFTVGSHIAFGPGEYAPGRIEGRGLIAHELAHAIERPALNVLFRKDKPKQPTLEEAETALGTLLREPPNSSGLTLTFYDKDEPEAKRRADDFAARESAVGFSGDKPTAHSIKIGKAISGVFDIDKTVMAITDVAAAALKRVPAPANLPAASADAPAKVRTIAVFAHGTSGWCSLGVTTGNAGKIFKAVAPRLSTGLAVNIILYTCSSARGSDEEENWQAGTLDPGGKGSLAEKVRDTLADEKIDNASVWGHTTVGHPTRNFALRVFETKDGKGSQGQSFASTYVFDDTLRNAAIDDMVKEVSDDGYTVDGTDKTVRTRAAAVLQDFIYAGYAAANANLEGVNPAEDAPVYRYMTASRIEKYWKEDYWPGKKAKAAKKLIKALKLKKPKEQAR